jgi:hypothetical protein
MTTMAQRTESGAAPREIPAAGPYEAPRIETVLTPEDLEREVTYAGTPSTEP